jgi:predicted RNase H-like HicB family nuclease
VTAAKDIARRYTVILEDGEDGFVVVSCPALPGCWSQGRTRAEALENIKEAIELYIEALIENNERVPVEETATVEVSV